MITRSLKFLWGFIRRISILLDAIAEPVALGIIGVGIDFAIGKPSNWSKRRRKKLANGKGVRH